MKKVDDKENKKEQKKSSPRTFVIALALISIIGFIGIISETMFNYNMKTIVESSWIIILGISILIKTKLSRLKSLKEGLSSTNFPYLTNLIIGLIAVISGILSSPFFKITNPAFHAIRGIISIIAIAVIIIETWIVKKED
ncbi:MAG: hypothetical protein QW041_00625 [Candidatus Pacearchaeota archaeon]